MDLITYFSGVRGCGYTRMANASQRWLAKFETFRTFRHLDVCQKLLCRYCRYLDERKKNSWELKRRGQKQWLKFNKKWKVEEGEESSLWTQFLILWWIQTVWMTRQCLAVGGGITRLILVQKQQLVLQNYVVFLTTHECYFLVVNNIRTKETCLPAWRLKRGNL